MRQVALLRVPVTLSVVENSPTPPGATCHTPDGDPRTKDTLVSVEMAAGSEELLGRPQGVPALPCPALRGLQ